MVLGALPAVTLGVAAAAAAALVVLALVLAVAVGPAAAARAGLAAPAGAARDALRGVHGAGQAVRRHLPAHAGRHAVRRRQQLPAHQGGAHHQGRALRRPPRLHPLPQALRRRPQQLAGAVRLVGAAEDAAQHRAHLLLAARRLHPLRSAGAGVRARGGGSAGAPGGGAAAAAAGPARPREAAAAGRLRQHLHELHVLRLLRLRRPRLQEDGAHLRRDLLGDQPGLRGGLHAVAGARVPRPHAPDLRLGGRDPPVHPVAHHRVAPALAGPRPGAARLHRRAAALPGGGPAPQLGAHHLRARGLSRWSLGHRQPADAGAAGRRAAPRGGRAHPARGGRGHRRLAARLAVRQAGHALHRGHHPGDAAHRLVPHRAARGHAGHVGGRLRRRQGHRRLPQQLRAEQRRDVLGAAGRLPARALPVGRRRRRRQAGALHPVQHGQAHLHRPAAGAGLRLRAARRAPADARRRGAALRRDADLPGVRRRTARHLPARLHAAPAGRLGAAAAAAEARRPRHRHRPRRSRRLARPLLPR